jgi:hypothetical protein
VPGRRLPLPSGQSFHPRHQRSIGEACLTRHQRGFKQFSRPVFPSPGAPGQNGNPSSFPSSFAPRRPGADDARRSGDRPSSTDLELHAQHLISRPSDRAFTHYVRPRVAPPGGAARPATAMRLLLDGRSILSRRSRTVATRGDRHCETHSIGRSMAVPSAGTGSEWISTATVSNERAAR